MSLALLSACGGGSAFAPSPLEPPPLQASDDPFDATLLHYVDLWVEDEHLPTLVPHGDERVPAELVFDGVVLSEVGLRLKGGVGSARPLGEKSGFSIKTNEFVKGQSLHGVKRFTLDNEVQDASLLAAHVGYELFRRAGLPARRTAFARVTFNGIYHGIYLVSEQIDGDFVKRHFPDDRGNLYEGDNADVTEPELMELKTNEDEDDRSDLEALRDLLLNADDEALLANLPAHVPSQGWYRYWACELLLDHWDAYSVTNPPPEAEGPLPPNNYYVYVERERGLAFLPHGMDQILVRPFASVFAPPSPRAVLASRLHATQEGRDALRASLHEVLDLAWDADALHARLEAAVPLIEASIPSSVPGNPSVSLWRHGVDRVRAFLTQREAVVRAQLSESAP